MKFIFPSFNISWERWKWNKEYRVYVSNKGHIRDEHKQLIAPKVTNRGYLVFPYRGKYKSIHRLVMLTWCPIPNAEDLTVDHLDHNKRNNSLDNLEWVSEKENQQRASRDYLSGNEPIPTDDTNNKKIKISKKNMVRYFNTVDEIVEYFLEIAEKANAKTVPSKEKCKKRIIYCINSGKKYFNFDLELI